MRREQNGLFKRSQLSAFYRSLQPKGADENIGHEKTPSIEITRDFWQDIWSKPVNHNNNAEWLEEFKSKVNIKDEMRYPDFIPWMILLEIIPFLTI